MVIGYRYGIIVNVSFLCSCYQGSIEIKMLSFWWHLRHCTESCQNNKQLSMQSVPKMLKWRRIRFSVGLIHADIINWKYFPRYCMAICAENSQVTGEFSAQRPVTRSFDVFFDLRLNKRLSKQSWGWWFETPSSPLWRHCNVRVLGEMLSFQGGIGNPIVEIRRSYDRLISTMGFAECLLLPSRDTLFTWPLPSEALKQFFHWILFASNNDLDQYVAGIWATKWKLYLRFRGQVVDSKPRTGSWSTLFQGTATCYHVSSAQYNVKKVVPFSSTKHY